MLIERAKLLLRRFTHHGYKPPMSDEISHQFAPYSPLVIAGTNHGADNPSINAAYRLAYILMMRKAEPVHVVRILMDVFVESGLLSEEVVKGVLGRAFTFAQMPVDGSA